MRIRPARPEEAAELQALTLASKGFWVYALERMREWGETAMEWEAEPHAAGFYARMGGRVVRTAISEWGRTLDVMAVDLPANR